MTARRPSGIVPALLAAALLVAPAASAQTAPATGLPAPAAADTVRTNIWLTEALMAEIVNAVIDELPPAPAAVRLVPTDKAKATELFGTVASRLLAARGYELYEAQEDEARQAAADVDFAYSVEGVELSYPDAGRTLGIWRRWVERNLSVTVLAKVTEASTGRLLLDRRLVRAFNDRVPDDDFGDVNSNLYPFTNAPTAESAWRRRLEEIVVLGALAGLVAIYFANTRD